MNMQTSVIVVDDDRDSVEVFSEFLEIKGVKVLGKGYDGWQGVKLFKELKPDVVLLDIMMPDYDGFYALENIRKLDSNAKVIVLTADLTTDTEKKLRNLSVNAIRYKPYDLNEMAETVEEINRGEIVVLKQ